MPAPFVITTDVPLVGFLLPNGSGSGISGGFGPPPHPMGLAELVVFPPAVAIYHLDGNGNDSSGNGHNLTVPGGVAYQAGKFGLGAYCTILNGNVNLSAAGLPVVPSGQPRAIAFWCYRTVNVANGAEVNVLWSGINPQIVLIFRDTSHETCGIPNGSGLIDSPDTFAEGVWHHFVETTDGSTMRVYGDTVLQITEAYSPHATDGVFHIGVLGGNNAPEQAIIDEVLVFDVDLTDQQIQALYHATGPFVQP